MASGADAVFLDLEDAVEAGRKSEARQVVAEFLTTTPASAVKRLVRINAPQSDWIDDDLAWLSTVSDLIDGVVIPKVESADQVERIAKTAPSRGVMLMIETARGVLRAGDIASANAHVLALILGAEDLTAELGIPRTVDGEELTLARSQVVMAAATIGADAIDAVFVDLKSPDLLRRDAMRARALGFRGKTAVHPDQIAIINEVFTPSADDVAKARRIIEADAAARTKGEGAFRFEDRMVDAPVVARARRVIALAEKL